MKKSVVVFYSKTGNNKFLAQKVSEELNCESIEIKPVFGSFPSLMFSTIFKIGSGINKINLDISDYENVIMCGPIWAGNIISPVATFMKKNIKSIKNPYLATSCGSTEDAKNDKFGYEGVFDKIKKSYSSKIKCAAFPIDLVIPQDKKDDKDVMMNTRLNNDNFKGEIADRLNKFLEDIK